MMLGENLPMDTLTAVLTATLEGDDKNTPSDRYLNVCHLRGADQALSSKFPVFWCNNVSASVLPVLLNNTECSTCGPGFAAAKKKSKWQFRNDLHCVSVLVLNYLWTSCWWRHSQLSWGTAVLSVPHSASHKSMLVIWIHRLNIDGLGLWRLTRRDINTF